MRRALLPLALAAALACAPTPLPEPRLLAITPSTLRTDQAPPVTLELDAQPSGLADFSAGTIALQPGVDVYVGAQRVGRAPLEADGRVHLRLPPGLPVGLQTVRARLEDGREAVERDALNVLPARSLTGYTVDPVDDQVAGVPFVLTVRAEGPDAPRFDGVVLLSVNKGDLAPELSSPFVAGVLAQQVTITVPNVGVQVRVQDAAGRVAVSVPFRVAPP